MALATYSGLKASVSKWTDGADLSSTDGDLIALAEAEINAQLADAINKGAVIRPMIGFGALTIDGEYVSIPDAGYGMVQPISLEVTGLSRPWPVTFISPENLLDLKYDQDQARCEVYEQVQNYPPRYYSVVGDSFRFFPVPQSAYTAEFTRYTKLSALSDANPTNWLLTYHPNAYLYGALAQAELLGWNDERVSSFASLFANAMGGLAATYPSLSDSRPLRADIPAGMRYSLPC